MQSFFQLMCPEVSVGDVILISDLTNEEFKGQLEGKLSYRSRIQLVFSFQVCAENPSTFSLHVGWA